MTKTIEALYSVVSRRTLDSFAIQILKTTTQKLESEYPFLRSVELHDEIFLEEGVKVTFDQSFNTIKPNQVGEAIDALIRVIYLELIEAIGDDVGLFFINELKDHMGDQYTDELRSRGVHLEAIQTEQHLRYQMKGIRPSPPSRPFDEGVELPEYSWDTVSTWKYDNNVCRLYDSKGKLLDTLQLDLIIEEYIEHVSEEKKHQLISTPTTTMVKVSDKEKELLEMMRRRDIDVESAVALLHISRQKLDVIIQKLLKYDLLQHISDNEVKITEKGIQFLMEKNR